jgi:hypothetical protein
MKLQIKRLRIREAIKHFNNNRKNGDEKLTSGKLALKVITDRDILPESKEQLFSQYNSGSVECPHNYVAAIANETGVTSDFLLGLTDEPTVVGRVTGMIQQLTNSNKTK